MPDSTHYWTQRVTVSKLNRNTDADTGMHSVHTDKQLTDKTAYRQQGFLYELPTTLYLEMTHNCCNTVYLSSIFCMTSN